MRLYNYSKKIYLITIYTNENYIKCTINEDNEQSYFEKYFLNNYDVLKVNIESQDELLNSIDNITREVLQEKNLIISDVKITITIRVNQCVKFINFKLSKYSYLIIH